jgi:ADP-ribosylglycohydrolase
MVPNANRQPAALRSLLGLSVGDAFGECFFSIALNDLSFEKHLSTRTLPNWRWRWTDDTAMAISVVEMLMRIGQIDQDELATAFAERYTKEDNRGYGGTAHGILRSIHAGENWRDVSPKVLSGMGSMGNGGAMRVAPLGAYLAGDTSSVVEEARKSSEVTHSHPEGQAGAIAVALAAAYVAGCGGSFERDDFFNFILDHTPDSKTRAMIRQAMDLPSDFAIDTAVSVLGNGQTITAPETVPFCLWCAAKFPFEFENAMWTTVAGGGDYDTNCAIVGGIVSSSEQGIPPGAWIAKSEQLPEHLWR